MKKFKKHWDLCVFNTKKEWGRGEDRQYLGRQAGTSSPRAFAAHRVIIHLLSFIQHLFGIYCVLRHTETLPSQSDTQTHNVLCLVAQSFMSDSFVTPWTVAHQAPLPMGILQARILEWVAMPSSRGSSQPRDQTQASCMAGGFFYCLSHQGSPLPPVFREALSQDISVLKEYRIRCIVGVW